MPDSTRRNCVVCKGHDSVVGPISWSGKCRTCGKTIMNETLDQLATAQGPIYHHWLSQLRKSVGFGTFDPSSARS